MAAPRLSRRLAALSLVALPAVAAAQPITFDDLNANGYTQLTSYHNVDWSNTFVLEAGTSFDPVAAASSPNVIFPGFGSLSGFMPTLGGTFTLGSIDFVQWAPFGGAPAPSTTVTGYLAGAQLYQTVVPLGATYATTLFNWSGIDQVTFDQQGQGWYVADNVVLGNISVSATPEPATLALLGGGLLALGAVRRRNRA